MKVFDNSWRTFAVRGLVLCAAVFGTVRFAMARPGVAGGPAGSFVTVAGTVTGLPGDPRSTTMRFTFHRTMREGSVMLCSPEVRDVPLAPGGAFAVQVPLDAMATPCPGNMFDGRDVEVDVAVGGTTAVTNAAINPVPYAHFASQYGTPDCPVSYERDATNAPSSVRLCRKVIQDGLADYVVRVGSGATAFWIDRFEASIWVRAPGTTTSLANHNSHAIGGLPTAFRPNGQWRSVAVTEPFVFAYSAVSVTPASNITWFQANEACAASGKRLATGDDWLRAAQGTPDPDVAVSGASASQWRCNTAPPDIHQAHRLDDDPTHTDACVSVWGATDMIGNLWEWTADWYAGAGTMTMRTGTLTNWPTDGYGNDGTYNVVTYVAQVGGPVGGVPAAAARGGSYLEGPGAGVFAFALDFSPALSNPAIGFRCVIPR